MTRCTPGEPTAEKRVFDRIEAFRRRRPRLLDDVVTLAHGAGGKASAALLDACSCRPLPTRRLGRTDRRRRADAAGGDRLAFSTDSFVVKPLRFPGGSVGHLAVHGTVNDLAVMGARPLALSAAFVLEEGCPSTCCATWSPTWRRPRPPPAYRSSPVTPRWWTTGPRTGCTSPPPGWA